MLALFHGAPARGTVVELSVGLTPDEIGAVRARISEGATLVESEPDHLRFEDPFGFRWVVQPYDATFRSSGEIGGRWIQRED